MSMSMYVMSKCLNNPSMSYPPGPPDFGVAASLSRFADCTIFANGTKRRHIECSGYVMIFHEISLHRYQRIL